MQERLQKYLARAGVASRRHAEQLITQGLVAVNNKVVTELGTKVQAGKDLVTVEGKLVAPPGDRSYYALYKPPSVVTTMEDPQGRPTVADYLFDVPARVFPVGRLDYDAEGALLLTDDGELSHKLLHPSYQVPRTYLAKVKGSPTEETIAKLRGGVRLEDGMAKPVSVDLHEKAEKNTWLKIVVAEGRQHLIKRLCAAIGHPVVRLFRPSYAGISVDGLRPGDLRPLTNQEVERLQAVARGEAPAQAERELKLPPRRHGHGAPGFEPEEESELELGDGEDGAHAASEERGEARESAVPEEGAHAKARRKTTGGGSVSGGATKGPGGRASRSLGDSKESGVQRTFGTKEKSVGAGPRKFGATNAGRKEFGVGREGGDRPRKPFEAPTEGGARRAFGRGASQGGEDRPRKSFGAGTGAARKSFGGKPYRAGSRKPYGEGAGGEDAPRKPFGAGAGGARKPFGAGARGAEGPRKPFGARAGGEDRPRKPFGAGARAEGGPRKPFGAGAREGSPRKPFGAGEGGPRKSFGGGGFRGGEERPRKSFGAGSGGFRSGKAGADRPRKPFGAGARGEDRPRKPFGAGARGEDRSRKPFGAGARGEDRPRKPFGAGARGEDRPRKPFGAGGGKFRGGEDRPRKPFGAGARGEGGPRKPFGAKGRGEDRPRKPFGASAGGEDRPRKPFSAGGVRGSFRGSAEKVEGRPFRASGSFGGKGSKSFGAPPSPRRGAPSGEARPRGLFPRGPGGTGGKSGTRKPRA